MLTFSSSAGYPNVLAMVMAGGEGSRLHPLTKDRAKPSVYFGGKYRIIDFVLNNFVNSGMFKVKVLTQFKADSLIKHLTAGWNLNRMLGQYIDPCRHKCVLAATGTRVLPMPCSRIST